MPWHILLTGRQCSATAALKFGAMLMEASDQRRAALYAGAELLNVSSAGFPERLSRFTPGLNSGLTARAQFGCVLPEANSDASAARLNIGAEFLKIRPTGIANPRRLLGIGRAKPKNAHKEKS